MSDKEIDHEARQKSFAEAAEPMMKWINEHGHPHATVIIDCTHAEFLSGEIVHATDKFVKD